PPAGGRAATQPYKRSAETDCKVLWENLKAKTPHLRPQFGSGRRFPVGSAQSYYRLLLPNFLGSLRFHESSPWRPMYPMMTASPGRLPDLAFLLIVPVIEFSRNSPRSTSFVLTNAAG